MRPRQEPALVEISTTDEFGTWSGDAVAIFGEHGVYIDGESGSMGISWEELSKILRHPEVVQHMQDLDLQDV